MIEVLNSYLLQHKSLSIPGLGTIYIERIPAQSDFVNKQLLPPSYHYRFNKYQDAPEKDFFTYLAAKEGIADYEAIKLYNEWASDLRKQIREQEGVVWDGVGKLSQDHSGEIVFEPNSSIQSFLKPVTAERVLRSNAQHTMIVGDREVTNVEMSEYFTTEEPRRRRFWWIYALVLGVIALAAVVFYMQKHGWNIESTSNKQNLQIR